MGEKKAQALEKEGSDPLLRASPTMELFNKLPFELQGLVLSRSHVMRRATPAQLDLFQSLPPDAQQKVYNDAFSSDDVHDSYNYLCTPSSERCVLRFCLYG